MKRRFFSKTLHRKVLLLLLIVGFVPAMLGIVQTYFGTISAMDNTIGGYLQERVERLAGDLDQVIETKSTELTALTSRPDFINAVSGLAKDTPSDPKRAQEQFDTTIGGLLHEFGVFDDIFYVADEQGVVLYAKDEDMPTSFASLYWWKPAIQMEPGKVYFTDFYDLAAETPYLLAIAPVHEKSDSSPLVGVFVIKFRLDRFLILLDVLGVGETTAVGVYSSRGYLLYSQNASVSHLEQAIRNHRRAILNQMSGWFPADFQGNEQIVSFTAIRKLRGMKNEGTSDATWYLLLSFDISGMLSYINLLLWKTILIGIVLLGLICLLGYMMTRRIIGPIKTLSREAGRIAAGDFEAKVRIQTGDEIEDLAAAFNEMSLRLRESYGALETQVVELDEKANQLALMNEISRAANSALELHTIFQLTFEKIRLLVDYDRASIALLNETEENLVVQFAVPTEREFHSRGEEVALEGSNLGRVVRSGKPLVRTDLVLKREGHDDERLFKEGIRSIMIYPLISPSGVIGTFGIGSKEPNYYGERESQLLSEVTGVLAVAIVHSQLYMRARKFAEELEEKVRLRTRDLQRAQIKLVQTEKFAATGRLAANLAHEINNPLGIIKNYLRLIEDRMNTSMSGRRASDPTMDNLMVINEELERVARIIRNLLDFYRPTHAKNIPTDVNGLIEQLLTLMERNLEKKGIKLRLSLSEALPHPNLSPDQLRQVFLNLIRNAEDAMDSGGVLSISSSLEKMWSNGQQVSCIRVSIEDTGCGIHPEHMEKIFDPFFTTKKEGTGTGLGLSVTYGILESLGGAIDVRSAEGKGSTFTVRIPVSLD